MPHFNLPSWTLLAAGLMVAAPASSAELPLTSAADDDALKWSACPDFMPRGCAIAVLHGDPAKDNADVFFRVPAGAVIPRHWHTSAERMVLVAGELTVTYDGHPAVTLISGRYAYGPAKLPHHAVCGSSGPCVLFIAFESPIDAIAGAPQ